MIQMKLYEVNQAIEDLWNSSVDAETGEFICDMDEFMLKLDSLQMERSRILEYLAKLVLNAKAEAAMLKAEEDRLKKRREAVERRSERIMEILDRECAGEKTDCGVATVSYRASERLIVNDNAAAAKWLMDRGYGSCLKISDPEVKKTETKKLVKNGADVPGVVLEQYKSCSLR